MDAGLLVASALIGLAAYRGWRIIGKDQITEPIRAWLIQRESRLAMFVLDLIGCAWCAGFWLAGIGAFVVFHHGGNVAHVVIVWLSASAVAGLLGMVDGLLTRRSESPGT